MDSEHIDWDALKKSLNMVQSPAWVHDKSALFLSLKRGNETDVLPISGPSEILRVVDFDPNHLRIKTNFLRRKFLVFNDSYYSGWMVLVNGKKQPLYRTNIAFKGVWVDSGNQDVEFRFGTAGQFIFHWGLMGLFVLLAGYIGYLFIKKS